VIKLDKDKIIPSAVDQDKDESQPAEDPQPKTIKDEPGVGGGGGATGLPEREDTKHGQR